MVDTGLVQSDQFAEGSAVAASGELDKLPFPRPVVLLVTSFGRPVAGSIHTHDFAVRGRLDQPLLTRRFWRLTLGEVRRILAWSATNQQDESNPGGGALPRKLSQAVS
jgi:hypothetical protein